MSNTPTKTVAWDLWLESITGGHHPASLAKFARAVLAKWGTPQPAPAPLSDDAKDAARYRLLRRGRHWSVIDGIGNDLLRAEALDAAIDAALAAQGGK